MTIAVVGAGIAGLTAAWELQRSGADVVVLEQERRPGGVIVTERPDGGRWIVEGGPDSWLASDHELAGLAADLGIADRILGQDAKGSHLWNGKVLAPLAEGEAAKLLGFGVKAADLQAGFQTFRTGMADIIDALAAALTPGTLHRTGVTAAQRTARGYRLSGCGVEAEGLVIALPPAAAARLLLGLDAEAARPLQEVTYLPSLSVSLAYRAEQVGAPLDGTGFLTAPEANEVVRACTYASHKFAGRAPDGHVLLRVFLAWGEGEARTLAHARLASILEISGEPLWARMFRWPRGIPVYARGHAERLAAVRERLAAFPPIALCGAGHDGPGVSACVRSGKEAARKVLGG
jgi:oxygen-dependent protoporphyrinogen oxidase